MGGMLWSKATLGMRSQHLTDACCLLHGICTAKMAWLTNRSMLTTAPLEGAPLRMSQGLWVLHLDSPLKACELDCLLAAQRAPPFTCLLVHALAEGQ